MIEVLTKLQSYADAFGELKDFSLNDSDYIDNENGLKDTWSVFSEKLQQRIGEQDTKEKLSVFIKLTQDRLTDFADTVFEYYKEVEIATTELQIRMKKLFSDIQTEVVKVLEFLKINFSASFNYYGKVPRWIFYKNKELLLQKSQIIQGLENKGISEDLVVILKNFLDGFQNSESHEFKNWHQYAYFKKLVTELSFFVESLDTGDDTIRLIKLLIGYNFNPLTFYEFMLEFAEEIVDKETAYEEQEMELLNLLRIIDNIRPEVKKGYNPEVPPILESVSGSIRRELEMITKVKEVQAPDILNGTEKRSSWYYFEVVSTIEELFFLIKIMLAVRFIKSRYNANIYRFVERHIKTDRTKSSSPQYMRNILAPGWVFSSKVVRKVRSWLMAMITYIDTHFVDQLKVLFIIWILKDPIILDLLTISPTH